ncbi:MAG: PepSY domain-containing protein [Phaeospirillum sp.]|nr:PepSY domain-containing protein [Phaeospirillum sp.]
MTYAPLILAALIAFTAGPALASDGHGRSHDHDRARRAVEEGRILPLKEILNRAETAYPGQLIEAELEDDDGPLVYEIKMLTKDGRLMKLLYDAQTGELIKAKSRDNRR